MAPALGVAPNDYDGFILQRLRWAQGTIQHEEVEELARVLASEGGYGEAKEASIQMTDMAINALREADPQGETGEALFELTNRLLNREQ